ncbi:MAG: hypothetical protein JWL94_2185 [Microbacteriaceae bacterium]|jgi:sugar/nucleoside kinase (ribokinase family)|nr:hypothetical protein [Microbacteriaceae bacterium]
MCAWQARSRLPGPRVTAVPDVSGDDRIVVFGDVIDDIVVVPSGPIRTDTDTPASIRHCPGGSAANVAAWLGSLGAPVDFVGVVGEGDLARHCALMRGGGIRPLLGAHRTLPTGAIVVLVDGERRSMLTERGANASLDPRSVTDELLDAAGLLHLSGYNVMDSADPVALRNLIARAVERGVDISVDPGSAGNLADFGAKRFLDAISGARLLFPNLEEGRVLTGASDPELVAMSLARRFSVVALTLGRDGVVVASGDSTTRVAAVSASITDPTGAGDAFCAGFLASWMRDRDAVSAANAGVRLAAGAVAVSGGRPVSPIGA